MTVKRKLHLAYILMLLSTVGIGGIATWSVVSWKRAAADLAYAHAQGLRVERVRGNIYRQIKEVLDRLVNGDEDADEEFRELGRAVEGEIQKLEAEARGNMELQAVQGLRESYQGLVSLAEEIFEDPQTGEPEATRMEEEVERRLFPELEARIETLRVYYRDEAARSIDRTVTVGSLTRRFVGIIVLLSLIQGGILLFGIQRWLVKPLATIGRSTGVISTGDLTHRIEVTSRDELGELAQAINRMAEALKENQAQLVRSERLAAVGELASYIAHNIRNPLASIRAAAQVGLEESEAEQETFKDIIGAVDRLERWVQSLLSYMRPLTLQSTPQDLNRIIQDALSVLMQEMALKRLRPRLDLSPLPRIELDGRWMEQVLSAILRNAIEASSQGGRLCISSSFGPGGVTVRIEDGGKGIPREILDRVFVPYFTTKSEGIGLGLPMAKKIVEAHQGAIELKSEDGKGTTVTIHLPSLLREGGL